MQSRSRLSVIVFILVLFGGHPRFNYRGCPDLNLRQISQSESEALVTHIRNLSLFASEIYVTFLAGRYCGSSAGVGTRLHSTRNSRYPGRYGPRQITRCSWGVQSQRTRVHRQNPGDATNFLFFYKQFIGMPW